MVKANRLGAFMRSYGLRLLYFPYVLWVMYWYVGYMTEDASHLPQSPSYSWHKTIWLGTFRVGGAIMFIPSLAFAALYLFARMPRVIDGPDTDVRIGHIDSPTEDEKHNGDGIKNGNGYKNGYHKNGTTKMSSKKRHQLPCMIIRAITRGDYPELIRRSVSYHIRLFEKYCDCPRLEYHLVTERSLGGDYKVPGTNGHVREFLVPAGYKTRKGTMARARNMVYYLEATKHDEGYPPDDLVWILTMDEDVLVTDSFVQDLFETFIPSGALYGGAPSLFEVPSFYSFLTRCEECFVVTFCATGMWLEAKVGGQVPLWMHGSATVVRRDVEKSIGFEYPPELCISCDHVFANNFAEKYGNKIGYIDGWNWEFGAPSLLGLLKQRARWLRGLTYAAIYQQGLSKSRRAWCIARLFLTFVPNGGCAACAVWGTLVFLVYPVALFPGGARFWLDYLNAFTFANYFYAIIYGSWHYMSTRAAVCYTIAASLWIGPVACFAVHSIAFVWTGATMIEDFYKRRLSFEVTEKK